MISCSKSFLSGSKCSYCNKLFLFPNRKSFLRVAIRSDFQKQIVPSQRIHFIIIITIIIIIIVIIIIIIIIITIIIIVIETTNVNDKKWRD